MEHKQLKIKNICELTSYTRQSVNRIVTTLVQNDYLQKDEETKFYSLGNTVYFLGQKANINTNVLKKAKPIVDNLSRQTGFTITLSSLDEYETIVVYKKDSNTSIALAPDIGGHRSVHCSASGKVLTTFSEITDLIIENIEFIKMTESTILTKEAYLKTLDKVLELGYAFDDEEVARGLFCIAVPILKDNLATYAISMSGYKEEIYENIEEYISLLKRNAKLISNTIY